jgi:hypothetical protein
MRRAFASLCGILLVVGAIVGSRAWVEAGPSPAADRDYAARRACIDDVANHSDDYQDEGALSAAVAGCRHGS